MFFKHLPLPDLIGAWLHDQTPHMHKRRTLSKRRSTSLPRLPITWHAHDSTSRTPVKSLRRKLSSHLPRRKKNRDSQDDRNMSESARIAFAYRSSQNSGRAVSDSGCRSSRRIHLISGRDDDEESGPDVSSITAETTGNRHKSSGLSDMLSPIIIEMDDEEVIGQERCRLALRRHRSIYNNVVVESQCPDRSPHIVITPPPEQDVFEATCIAQKNQIPFQYHPSLPVPPLCRLTCRLMTFEQWRAMIYSQSPSFEGPVNQNTSLVFSNLKFTQWVKGTEEHRNCLFRRLVIPAVTRHLVKASAVTASTLAPSFRARYDSPEFLESLDNPFRWSDPAPALLSLYRGHPVGVHHVPSPEPFSVPHILIEESFGNDQTIVDGNVAPIQSSADRKSLAVPTSTKFSLSLEDLEIDEISLNFDSSTCQSSAPKTPIEVGKVDYGFFSSWDIGTPLRDGDLFPEIQCLPTTRPYRDSKALFFIEEEEEEEFI